MPPLGKASLRFRQQPIVHRCLHSMAIPPLDKQAPPLSNNRYRYLQTARAALPRSTLPGKGWWMSGWAAAWWTPGWPAAWGMSGWSAAGYNGGSTTCSACLIQYAFYIDFDVTQWIVPRVGCVFNFSPACLSRQYTFTSSTRLLHAAIVLASPGASQSSSLSNSEHSPFCWLSRGRHPLLAQPRGSGHSPLA